MKTYVKSISVKVSDLNRQGSDPNPLRNSKKECSKPICDAVQASLKKFNEYAVEWDICHDGLEISRMICKTVIWLALIGAFTYIAIRVCK